MERNAKLQNAYNPLPPRDLAAEVLGAWRNAIAASGLSGKREIDTRRIVRGMADMAGSGFAGPGIISGSQFVPENGPEHPKDHRETSFNDKASSK